MSILVGDHSGEGYGAVEIRASHHSIEEKKSKEHSAIWALQKNSIHQPLQDAMLLISFIYLQFFMLRTIYVYVCIYNQFLFCH